MKRIIFILVIALSGISACHPRTNPEAEKNRVAANKDFDAIQLGMTHEEGCKTLKVKCHLEQAHLVYSKDVGVTFSRNEYSVMMYINDHKVVRAEIWKPHFEKQNRRNDPQDKIVEKGIPMSEWNKAIGIRASPSP